MVALQVGRTSFLGSRPPHLEKRKLTHESESSQHSTKLMHQAEISWIPESGLPYMGLHTLAEICLFIFIFVVALCLYLLRHVYRFWKSLWRILRPDEDPKVGLVAKDPQACKEVLSHVNYGGRKGYKSQYISTTASYAAAQRYKAKGEEEGLTGLRIAEIDLDALPKHCELKIWDLTTEENRDKYLGNSDRIKNYARASCEVLLTCNMPIPCHVVDPPEEKYVLERLFRAADFIPF